MSASAERDQYKKGKCLWHFQCDKRKNPNLKMGKRNAKLSKSVELRNMWNAESQIPAANVASRPQHLWRRNFFVI